MLSIPASNGFEIGSGFAGKDDFSFPLQIVQGSVLGCVCVEAQGLMYDVYICVLPKQEKVVPDISPIPWFQQVYLSSYLRLDVTSSAWCTELEAKSFLGLHCSLVVILLHSLRYHRRRAKISTFF